MPAEHISSDQYRDGKHAEKRAIPKFASFKPNTPSRFQSQETIVPDTIQQLPKNHIDAPNESVSRLEPQRQNLGRHRPRELDERRRVNQCIGSKSTRPDSGAGENIPKSFVVDRVGDPNNLHFGALHKYATTSYFRFGAGNVVGSHRNQKIDPAVSTDKELVLCDNTHALPKKRDNRARWRLHQEAARKLKIKPREEHNPAIDSAADYIALEAAQRAKRRRGDDGLPVDCVSSSDDDTNYRSVEGKAKPSKQPADQDLKYDSDASSSQDIAGKRLLTLDESTQNKRVQLSRRVDAEPHSFEAWINLIDHQDNMLGLGQNFTRSSPTNAERRSNAEIKLAMFEKALGKVQDSEGREVLLLGMMQEAHKIWGVNKISSCWKSIIQQNPQCMRLWTKYLDFRQTSFTYFRFGEVQSVYVDCLNLIDGVRTSGKVPPDDPNRKFHIQIYLVLRMTLFMRESGFAEYATAAWQALLEFVFFKPISVRTSGHNKDGSFHETAVSMFENFWDSEVPRVGEEGAEGWAGFSQKQREPPQPIPGTVDDLENSKDHWKSWLASERSHSLLSRNPARTIDDIENDPYRIVLFSDIRPFLIDPPSLAGQQLILDAFNVFCCLPPFAAEGPDSCSRVWGRDSFLRNDALRLNGKLQSLWKLHFPKQHQSPEQQDSISKEDTQSHSDTHDPFQFPIRDYQVSADSLFAEKQWFCAFDTWQEQCLGDSGPVEVEWVLRSLKSLISVFAGEEAVALYVLALELRISPGTVRKSAKNNLRKRPFSVRLYLAYALIEYRLGDTKKGEGIITTTINMAKKLDEVSQRDSILLWRTWIWETLSANSAQEALVRLLAIGDEEIKMPFPQIHLSGDRGSAEPTQLLRTERVGLFLSSDGPC